MAAATAAPAARAPTLPHSNIPPQPEPAPTPTEDGLQLPPDRRLVAAAAHTRCARPAEQALPASILAGAALVDAFQVMFPCSQLWGAPWMTGTAAALDAWRAHPDSHGGPKLSDRVACSTLESWCATHCPSTRPSYSHHSSTSQCRTASPPGPASRELMRPRAARAHARSVLCVEY